MDFSVEFTDRLQTHIIIRKHWKGDFPEYEAFNLRSIF